MSEQARSGAAHTERAPETEIGWCSHELAQELPQLRLVLARAPLARPGSIGGRSLSDPSPPSLQGRLHELSNRFRGARAVSLRREPVPGAYRAFYHQVGLDPDLVRTPIEAAALTRMLDGGFLGTGLLKDSLLIALLDTAVPVWALDAGALQGPLGLRVSRAGEPLGRSADAPALTGGAIVLADAIVAVGTLFGELAEECEPSTGTRELILFAVQVAGVPEIYVEEALWICLECLQAGA
jgi:DNA/RNA-binding domain of Phe-tRNA-synthetase-like protein